jgi:hypothetical protein
MPQFDTFSFFSQLFWVFLGFSFVYLVLCFFLLPALAFALKTRRSQSGISTIQYKYHKMYPLWTYYHLLKLKLNRKQPILPTKIILGETGLINWKTIQKYNETAWSWSELSTIAYHSRYSTPTSIILYYCAANFMDFRFHYSYGTTSYDILNNKTHSKINIMLLNDFKAVTSFRSI